MKKVIHAGFLVGAMLLTTAFLKGQDSPAAVFGGIVETVYAGGESEERVAGLIEDGLKSAGSLGSPEGDYWQAELNLLRGRMLLEKGKKEDADKYLARAEEKAVTVNRIETASSMALIVEVRTAMFGTRGLGYILGNSDAIGKLLDKAFEREPLNARILMLKGNGELYKPFGNIDAAIRFFTSALERPDIAKPLKFTVLLGLAEAWNKKWDGNRRRESLLKARELYPDNPALLKALKEAGVK